ncbi:hypothetical protein GF377_01145 [candidate division GN15 bacterium]|nr:hypothetical protein [candidate division GN15 bacterium]
MIGYQKTNGIYEKGSMMTSDETGKSEHQRRRWESRRHFERQVSVIEPALFRIAYLLTDSDEEARSLVVKSVAAGYSRFLARNEESVAFTGVLRALSRVHLGIPMNADAAAIRRLADKCVGGDDTGGNQPATAAEILESRDDKTLEHLRQDVDMSDMRLCLEPLEPLPRLTVTLRYSQDLTLEEIGEILDIDPEAARHCLDAGRHHFLQAIHKLAPT